MADKFPEWTREDIKQLLTDAISASIDLDWQPGDGAEACVHALEQHGLIDVSVND